MSRLQRDTSRTGVVCAGTAEARVPGGDARNIEAAAPAGISALLQRRSISLLIHKASQCPSALGHSPCSFAPPRLLLFAAWLRLVNSTLSQQFRKFRNSTFCNNYGSYHVPSPHGVHIVQSSFKSESPLLQLTIR